jgi:hypothetical protein
MTDLQISPRIDRDKDEDNKSPTPETQVPDTGLSRLANIDKVFTDLHATQTMSEIKVSTPQSQQPLYVH